MYWMNVINSFKQEKNAYLFAVIFALYSKNFFSIKYLSNNKNLYKLNGINWNIYKVYFYLAQIKSLLLMDELREKINIQRNFCKINQKINFYLMAEKKI